MIPLWVADTDFGAAPPILEALSARVAHGVLGYSTPPHELRAALVIVDMEGEKGCDAAAALGIPEGTLWRRLFQARTALRKAIDGGRS